MSLDVSDVLYRYLLVLTGATGPTKITSHPVSESFPMLNDSVNINRLNCDLIDLEPVAFEKRF